LARSYPLWEHVMIKYAVALVAVVSVCSAIPVRAEEVGIGVGPRGVTVVRVMVTVIAIVTVNIFGIGTTEVATKR
jgi:hypothetical protein